jgi:hypothetical protein
MDEIATATEISKLLSATDSELFAVLGAQALPLVASPSEFLELGRKGGLYVSGSTALGSTPEFDHRPLELFAKKFLRIWKSQLQAAVCGDSFLKEEVSKRGSVKTDTDLIAIAIASLSAHIPVLVPFSGLLIVLAVLIVRSGVKAFCEMLKDLSE